VVEGAGVNENDCLTDDETMTLIMSLGRSRGEKGFHERESTSVIEWAQGVRLNAALLDLVLKGELLIGYDAEAGYPTFRAPDGQGPTK
jgi:hypothetical protein